MVPYRGDTLRTEVVRCRTEVIRYVRRRCMVECGGGTRQTAAIPPDTTNSPNNQTF